MIAAWSSGRARVLTWEPGMIISPEERGRIETGDLGAGLAARNARRRRGRQCRGASSSAPCGGRHTRQAGRTPAGGRAQARHSHVRRPVGIHGALRSAGSRARPRHRQRLLQRARPDRRALRRRRGQVHRRRDHGPLRRAGGPRERRGAGPHGGPGDAGGLGGIQRGGRNQPRDTRGHQQRHRRDRRLGLRRPRAVLRHRRHGQPRGASRRRRPGRADPRRPCDAPPRRTALRLHASAADDGQGQSRARHGRPA